MARKTVLEKGRMEVNQIVNDLQEYPECNEGTLLECEERAKAGLRNVSDRDGMILTIHGLSEMKGEWTVRKIRAVNETEEHFAEDFIYSLAVLIEGEDFYGNRNTQHER